MSDCSTSSSGGKVAIIGNMNNGGFAIMRYLRDLGADTYLLPFSSDGQGGLAYFAPEADTWQHDRWRGFIRPLSVPNTTAALLSRHGVMFSRGQRRVLENALQPYAYLIGSGIAPALVGAIGRRLDVYFPYGTGVEFYGDIEFNQRRRASLVRRLVHGWLRRQQARGILAARYCLNVEMSLTRKSLDEMGKQFERLAIPAVYNAEAMPTRPPAHLEAAIQRLATAELALFCCARQLWWRNPDFGDREWRSFTKNSDWMFRGLATFVERHPHARVVLAVVEYGPDVEASRELVHALGLDEYVLWLPKMPRREIMLLLNAAHVGIGEFYRDPGVIWGGTGWETLAAGRPLMQSFNFTAEGFEAEFGHAPPPVLDVTCVEDVAQHMTRMYVDKEACRRIGRESLAWFNRNNGISLAAQWLQRATGQGAA